MCAEDWEEVCPWGGPVSVYTCLGVGVAEPEDPELGPLVSIVLPTAESVEEEDDEIFLTLACAKELVGNLLEAIEVAQKIPEDGFPTDD
jgi:hypothetical protein